jgi:hypothetical protein
VLFYYKFTNVSVFERINFPQNYTVMNMVNWERAKPSLHSFVSYSRPYFSSKKISYTLRTHMSFYVGRTMDSDVARLLCHQLPGEMGDGDFFTL